MERIDRLEKDICEVKKDIKEIMRNHLPHINADVKGLKTELRIYGGIVFIILTAIVALVGTLLKYVL